MLYVGILFCPKPTSTSCKITTLFISSLIFETNFHQRFLSKYLSQMFNILTDIIELGMQYIHILFSTNWMSTPVKWRIWLFHQNFNTKFRQRFLSNSLQQMINFLRTICLGFYVHWDLLLFQLEVSFLINDDFVYLYPIF